MIDGRPRRRNAIPRIENNAVVGFIVANRYGGRISPVLLFLSYEIHAGWQLIAIVVFARWSQG